MRGSGAVPMGRMAASDPPESITSCKAAIPEHQQITSRSPQNDWLSPARQHPAPAGEPKGEEGEGGCCCQYSDVRGRCNEDGTGPKAPYGIASLDVLLALRMQWLDVAQAVEML